MTILAIILTITSYIYYCKEHQKLIGIDRIGKLLSIMLSILSGLQGMNFAWQFSAENINKTRFINRFIKIPTPENPLCKGSEIDLMLLTLFMLALIVVSASMVIKEIMEE